jgi:hypothetical protein
VELLPDLSESRGPDVLHKVAETSNYLRRIRPELEVPSIPTRTEPSPPDPRALQRSDMSNLVAKNENLNPGQRDQLFEVILNYLDSFTEKPCKCNLFEYRFQVESNQPIATYSRPIPSAMRPAVRTQLEQLIRDDILEASDSPYIILYVTSLHLSSAYLQVPLHPDSWKYTAFLFDSTVYQLIHWQPLSEH